MAPRGTGSSGGSRTGISIAASTAPAAAATKPAHQQSAAHRAHRDIANLLPGRDEREGAHAGGCRHILSQLRLWLSLQWKVGQAHMRWFTHFHSKRCACVSRLCRQQGRHALMLHGSGFTACADVQPVHSVRNSSTRFCAVAPHCPAKLSSHRPHPNDLSLQRSGQVQPLAGPILQANR